MAIYEIEFIPQAHLGEEDAGAYLQLLEEYKIPGSFTLPLLRRRKKWVAPLPACAWDLSLSKLDDFEESVVRNEVAEKRRAEVGSYGFLKKRDVFLRNERWYYHTAALSALGPFLAAPVIAKALMRMLQHLEVGRFEPKAMRKGRLVRPPEQREFENGRRFRGPVWTEAEEYVLRKWFSRHTMGTRQGKHAKLTDTQWTNVLAELGGRRRKTDVRRRIVEMNRQLRVSLMVDGFLNRDAVARYKREALGESEPRVPRNRPLLGYHYRHN